MKILQYQWTKTSIHKTQPEQLRKTHASVGSKEILCIKTASYLRKKIGNFR